MRTYAVIMAGGSGTRFWPLSRQDFPKQFLNLSGEERLVNETIDRLLQFMKREDIFVITAKSQGELMYQLTDGRIEKDHILLEPAQRNTAACIGYCAMEIKKRYGDGVMCVLPADHYIKDKEAYCAVMEEAIRLSLEYNQLITIGIKPEFAATGYGYIRMDQESPCYSSNGKIPYYKVEEFVEKPHIKLARDYVESGNYVWNSGIFIWQTQTILEYFKTLLPDIYQILTDIVEPLSEATSISKLEEYYPKLPKISIDYGIMERADKVLVLSGDFGWSDVGSFDALRNIYPADENGNILYGQQILVETKNCISYSKNKLICALGVEDLIMVEADDVVLICHKDKTQEIGKVVEELKVQNKSEYL